MSRMLHVDPPSSVLLISHNFASSCDKIIQNFYFISFFCCFVVGFFFFSFFGEFITTQKDWRACFNPKLSNGLKNEQTLTRKEMRLSELVTLRLKQEHHAAKYVITMVFATDCENQAHATHHKFKYSLNAFGFRVRVCLCFFFHTKGTNKQIEM